MYFEIIRNCLISALVTHWRRLALISSLIVIATIALILLKPATYQASWVLLLPGTERSSTVNLDNIGEARTTTSSAYGNVSLSPKHTYREIALSSAVLNKAADRIGVPHGKFSKPRIKLIQQTPAIRFTLKSGNTEELLEQSQVFHDVFIEVLDELRANEIERQDQGVREQLAVAKRRLKTAQMRVLEFKSKGDVLTEGQLDIRTANFESLRALSFSAELALAKSTSARDKLSELLGVSSEQAADIIKLASHPQIVKLLPALQEANSELTELKAISGKGYPARKVAQAKVNQYLRLIGELTAKEAGLNDLKLMPILQLLDPQHSLILNRLIEESLTTESYLTELKKLKEQIAKSAIAMRNNSAEIVDLDELERDYQIAEAIFSSGLTRLDSSKFDVYASYPLVQLLTLPGGQILQDHLGSRLLLITSVLVNIFICALILLFDIRRQLLASNLPNTANYAQ